MCRPGRLLAAIRVRSVHAYVRNSAAIVDVAAEVEVTENAGEFGRVERIELVIRCMNPKQQSRTAARLPGIDPL